MSISLYSVFAFLTEQIFISLGIPILITGLLDRILNIVVFLSLKTFRQCLYAFILTIMSFVNIGQLLTGLLSRIMIINVSINICMTKLLHCYLKRKFGCFIKHLISNEMGY